MSSHQSSWEIMIWKIKHLMEKKILRKLPNYPTKFWSTSKTIKNSPIHNSWSISYSSNKSNNKSLSVRNLLNVDKQVHIPLTLVA